MPWFSGHVAQLEEERLRVAARKAIFPILSRYFRKLQAGQAATIVPSYGYRWRFYKPPMTIERMRKGMAELDMYLTEQMGYVNGRLDDGKPMYTAGPDLNRLPNLALVAFFQEVDTAFAKLGLTQDKPKEGE